MVILGVPSLELAIVIPLLSVQPTRALAVAGDQRAGSACAAAGVFIRCFTVCVAAYLPLELYTNEATSSHEHFVSMTSPRSKPLSSHQVQFIGGFGHISVLNII
jgi:hypothetical protein